MARRRPIAHLIVVVGILVFSGNARGSASLSVAVDFPAAVTAGDVGDAGDLGIVNVSTPTTLAVGIDAIRITPSCAKYNGSTCTSVDNGVFAIAGGIGRAGTACAGVAFTASPHAGANDGSLDLTLASPITLGMPGAADGSDRCIVDFTFDVLKYPAKDAAGATPGRQTLPGLLANGTASDGSSAVVFGSTIVTVQQATPTLATTASPDIVAGATITDTATIAAGASPTGKITFRLYGPDDATCSNAAVYTKAVTIAGNGSYSAGTYTPAAAGVYRWTAAYGGNASNVPVAGACNDDGESVTVSRASPTLVTAASAAIKLGATIADSATLAQGYKPTGTMTWTLYGPDDASCASAIFTTTKAVTANARYTSAAFTPTAPGAYRWIAAYSGNAANTPVSGACNDAGESVVVSRATPTLATTASAAGPLGTAVSDSATLASGYAPGGTLTFVLYAAGDTSCATPVFTSDAVAVGGNGTYVSTPSFVPTAVGTYRWRAFYSGDGNNAAIAGACGAARESVTISKVTPTVATAASAGGPLGTALTDQATISGGTSPTGTLRFRLYGPDDATCANAARFTSPTIAVSGNGTYASTPSFTPTTAGTWRWRASYSGDANNNAVTGPCNDAGENVSISALTPTLTTVASAGGAPGTALTDKATLAGGATPTGTITFVLYGPDDATCAATPAFTSSAIAVNGNGTYTSAPAFAAGTSGVYRWRALYGGDANNAAVAGACNDPGEAATILQTAPTLVTSASAGGIVGVPLTDQATLAGGLAPTGAITFSLFGPGDATCATTPVFTASVTVTGNGSYASPPFAPATVGSYRWIAAYGGDANNAGISGICGDAGESATIVPAVPTLVTTASAGGAIGVALTDQATLAGGFTPTGTLTFNAYGPNDSTCANAPAFTSTVVVNGNGTFASAPFTPPATGTWRWRALYGGDARNVAVAGACNAPGENAIISAVQPVLAAHGEPASPVLAGTPLHDVATLSSGSDPTGTITFALYGPDDPGCASTPAFTSSATVSGNGDYASAPFTPRVPGTWRWIASYGGDAANAPATGACDDPQQSVVVGAPEPARDVDTLSVRMLVLLGALLVVLVLAGRASPR